MIPELPTPPEQDGVALSGLRYRILGKVQPTVILDLDSRQGVFTDGGGLSWMTPTIDMSTNMQGGLLSGLARALSGATAFLIQLNTSSAGQAAFCLHRFSGQDRAAATRRE